MFEFILSKKKSCLLTFYVAMQSAVQCQDLNLDEYIKQIYSNELFDIKFQQKITILIVIQTSLKTQWIILCTSYSNDPAAVLIFAPDD